MSQVKDKIFFDSDPEKAWFKTFDALMIKNRDHRRILNRQPVVRESLFAWFLKSYYSGINEYQLYLAKNIYMVIDFKILSN